MEPTISFSPYEGTPQSCKVWARKGDGWERLEQVSSTPASVTIPIATLGTAAAGVSFLPTSSACLKSPATCQPQPVPLSAQTLLSPIACESVSASYCLITLPELDQRRTIDEFASLTVKDGKAYWVFAVKASGGSLTGVTVARYDLRAGGPVVLYRAYTGGFFGTIAERGRVAIGANGEVWAGIGGSGNVRFSENTDAVAFDRPAIGTSLGPVGVISSARGEVLLYRKLNVGTKTDVVRSVHRGAARTKPRRSSRPTETSSRSETLPAPARDMAFGPEGLYVISSGRPEIQLLRGGALTTIPLAVNTADSAAVALALADSCDRRHERLAPGHARTARRQGTVSHPAAHPALTLRPRSPRAGVEVTAMDDPPCRNVTEREAKCMKRCWFVAAD